MTRRTLLTLSTAACFSGMFALYALFVSPLITPRASARGKPNGGDWSQLPHSLPEARAQAEKHLAAVPWVADSKYQFRTAETLFYFMEWDKLEKKGHVRLTPFAMIWRPKDHPKDKAPYTLVAESALVEFARDFEITTNPNPGRIIGGFLEGAVAIRGPDGLSIDTSEIRFAEGARRVWSDSPVRFAFGPHSGDAQGLELDLIEASGPPDDDKPAVDGVRTVRLRKNVAMHLVGEAKSDAPAETVHVTSAGSFEYGVETNVATFKKNVQVVRPTGDGQSDKLQNCDVLTLVFEPDQPESAPELLKDAERETAGDGFAGALGNRQFRRLRAEGPQTFVVSERAGVKGWMSELTYDALDRVVALRDARRVRLEQRNNELVAPEITAMLDERGEITQAVCRGAGKMFSYSKDSAATARGPRAVDMAAEWKKQLRIGPDTRSELDLIEFEGSAVLSREGRMALQAEVIRVWVTPGGAKSAAGDAAQSGANAARSAPARREKRGEDEIRPQKLLAIDQVAFASPQISGETDRLEVWFVDGKLPPPPDEADEPDPRQPRQKVLRPAGRAPRASLASTPPELPDGESASRHRKPKDSHKAPDAPLVVEADVIKVQQMVEDDEIAQVITEGRVHVSQEHGAGVVPLDLTGDHLHLWNYTGDRQVLDVRGKPAKVGDRGMQLEGNDIHFDRGRNFAEVRGPGVLRLPVSRGFDDKPLDRPQLLDIFWQERMEFDGLLAKFFAKVRTQLDGHEMKCEEMNVTLANRISFAEDSSQTNNTDVKYVVCRDGVQLSSHEYEGNRLIGRRKAEAFEFTLDRATGAVGAQGPGSLTFWRRGAGNRPGMAAARANKPLQADAVEWEYTRIDFSGKMTGNTQKRQTTFRDRVRVVYGPVARQTDEVDEDDLPLLGGWMRCDKLWLSQVPESSSQKAYFTLLAESNVDVEGRSEHGFFHGKAYSLSHDESKGLYILSGEGDHDAVVTRESVLGAPRQPVEARRIELNPVTNESRAIRANRAEGGA